MKTMHTNHAHFRIAVELRFLIIPTEWTPREDRMYGDRFLVPAVDQSVERRLIRAKDPWELRNRFFRMENNEKSALKFLNAVGVWSATEDQGGLSVGNRGMFLSGAFGRRFFVGRALPLALEELVAQKERWRKLIGNRSKLRTAFPTLPVGDKIRPIDRLGFAMQTRYGNTLPVHLEWRGKSPRVLIQPITGEELLIALAWIDLITDAESKLCNKCGIEYTYGGYKYCSPQCEHARQVSRWRKKKKLVS